MEDLIISVIVPSFNGAEKLPQLMKALSHQSVLPQEVIVVLDGSIDESKKVLEDWIDILPLRIIEQENRGRSGARNRGATESRGDILVFYDDDMQPEAQSLELHALVHSSELPVLCAGQQVETVDPESEFSQYKSYLTKKWVVSLGKNPIALSEANLFLTAANMSIAKSLFIELQGFDERLTDAEDFDLVVKAHGLGHIVLFDPRNLAFHRSFDSLKDYIKRQREYRLAHHDLWQLRNNSSLSRYYRRYQESISVWKKGFYFFIPSRVVLWIDLGVFTFLPQQVRYKLYQRVVSALSVYYPSRKL